ncbi:MAG: hypothetical protein B7X02_02935 [Rhodospirillales bacterium 12-54-5]|nr:MAG: hypothetical protein B7X02_02935 [Rhodospirillales bacterium 12-54-5]
MENLTTIDSININGTISFLREFGRDDQADELARAYTAAQPDHPRFFDLSYHHFSADAPVDPVLKAAFEARQSEFKDERDPKAVLLAIGRGEPWQDEDVRLLGGVTADSFQAMIEGTEGEDLRLIVQTGLQIAARHQEDQPSINSALNEALARIAGKSPMRARRLRAWGYKAPPSDGCS